MKKLLLIGFMPLLLAGCKSCGNKSTALVDPHLTTTSYVVHQKTLNGVEQIKVPDMLKYFEQSMTDPSPAVQNFFISRGMLTKIVNLLEYEALHTKAGQTPTDGLRIYFSKLTADAKTSLLLIATRKFTPTVELQHKTHDDYFEHSSPLADVLFKNISDLEIPAYDDQQPGARIYKPSNTIEIPCTTSDSHYITRTAAEGMVARFKGKPIDTYAEWFDTLFLRGLLKDTKCTGIRIYLGRHTSTDRKHPNQVAFVLIPTHLENNVDEDNFDCSILKDYYNANKQLHEKNLHPFDNGELCPTNCN